MIPVYKDENANAIFIEDANGGQFINNLQSSFTGDDISILDLSRNIEIVTLVNYSEFVDKSGSAYGANASDVNDVLNALFTKTTSSDIFFAELDSNFPSSTSWVDVPFATAIRSNSSYTHSSGSTEIQLSAGDYEVHYGVLGDQVDSNNRVETQIQLLLDGTAYGFDANYSQRNNTQDTGGVNSFHFLVGVNDNDILKLQTQHVGSSNTIIRAKILIEKKY